MPTCVRPSIYTYIHTCSHTGIHTYIQIYAHKDISTYIHTYIHSYICTYTPIHTLAYTHTCIHIKFSIDRREIVYSKGDRTGRFVERSDMKLKKDGTENRFNAIT
ncbi:hypothetical protein LOAG_03669 [Loa loa]|uniref:Uncharacterized protein n=1 Tax=Loa loa TaxID=7209 RepID=A0A1S0U4P0_LOALO|nr:hypothetical protein LOAG_03669 [Loa loa]EFO24812.1 hypothetical protein LOAG_03669 [Loa loa]